MGSSDTYICMWGYAFQTNMVSRSIKLRSNVLFKALPVTGALLEKNEATRGQKCFHIRGTKIHIHGSKSVALWLLTSHSRGGCG
jgi:hypothetical protein